MGSTLLRLREYFRPSRKRTYASQNTSNSASGIVLARVELDATNLGLRLVADFLILFGSSVGELNGFVLDGLGSRP